MHFDFSTPAVHGVEATPAGTIRDAEDGQAEEEVQSKDSSEQEKRSNQSSRTLPLPSYRLSRLFNPCNVFGRFSHIGPIIVVYVVGVLLPFYVGLFGEQRNPTKYPFVQYFHTLTFMMRVVAHSFDVYEIVYWLKLERSKRVYGFRNFVILCDLCFCFTMLVLFANFVYPFMLHPTKEVHYHMWVTPTNHLSLVRFLFVMSYAYIFYYGFIFAYLLGDVRGPKLDAFFELLA